MKGQHIAPSQANHTEPVAALCQHYLLQSVQPMLQLQLIWIESVTKAFQLEADLFHAITQSNIALMECMTQNRRRCTYAEFSEHYLSLAKTFTDAHADRMAGVTQLSDDFRRCLWEEI